MFPTERFIQLKAQKETRVAILKNTSGPEAEKLKKKFQKLFEEKGLDIILRCSLKITNFLDITLNLTNKPTLYSHQSRPPAINH